MATADRVLEEVVHDLQHSLVAAPLAPASDCRSHRRTAKEAALAAPAEEGASLELPAQALALLVLATAPAGAAPKRRLWHPTLSPSRMLW